MLTAGVVAGDAGGQLVGLATCPVALQFKQVLHAGRRHRAGLHHAGDRTLVGLFADIATGIGDHVHLEPLRQR
ncbi:hypothetical protein G6F35_018206 [Rhizopus arrhizus]|nr:hypothetical protein G6F35_018206 [Rhizopus arrhizus]